jgi:hypothetical protein
VNRNYHARFAVAFFLAAVTVLSCRPGDQTGPAKIAALPADSQPHLTINLPLGAVMTSGTTEQIALSAANLKPQSCSISAPTWLGLKPGADVNAAWSVTPVASGSAALVTSCTDYRSNVVTLSDTLLVYPVPSVLPDISGIVPVDVGDSIDVSYDSTNTRRIDVACSNCGAYATLTRVAANTLRLFAAQVPNDTTHRGICFTVYGLDSRYTQQQCVGVAIMPVEASLYTVPTAVRAAEMIPLHTIPVATYDLTGQSTHPDFMRVNAPWAGGACWMSFTPYFQSNGWLENPSLATSSDCEHWAPAPGVAAPLVPKPANGYNSDPELMYDAKHGCLGVVFRQVYNQNVINLTSTCDGTTFSAPRTLFTAPNHSAVSPTVSPGPDGVNRVWYVDATQSGCSTEISSVKMRTAINDSSLTSLQFGDESLTDLAQPGYVIWHIKIRYVAALKQYIAMYAAFPQTTGIGDCTDDDLFLATSADGMHWKSYATPVLNHLDKRFKFTSMYRASFAYDPGTDQLRTIVSALAGSNWGQYGVVHDYSLLMTALNSSITASAAQLRPPSSLVRKADIGVKKMIMEDRP